MGFFDSIFSVKQLIQTGGVRINRQVINYLNHRIQVGDLIQFKPFVQRQADHAFHRRRVYHSFIMNMPRFIYPNYTLFYFWVERFPREKDLVFPIKLDMYRATGYY